LSDLLLVTGMLMLLGGALMWARSALAAQEVANRRYLVASVPLAVPMPDRSSFIRLAAGLPSPTPESPKRQVALDEPSTPEDLIKPIFQEEPFVQTEPLLENLVSHQQALHQKSTECHTCPHQAFSDESPIATSTGPATMRGDTDTSGSPAAG
jgi:hypothetical protein